MQKHKILVSIISLFLISCQNKITKMDLIQMSESKKGSRLSHAKFIWVECDSIRKSLHVPILGNDFYSFKDESYRMWYNPDTISTPRLVSIIHNIRYYKNDSIAFNNEIGEIQLNDSLSLAYGFDADGSKFGLIKTNLKLKKGNRSLVDLSRREFDSIIALYGANSILNY